MVEKPFDLMLNLIIEWQNSQPEKPQPQMSLKDQATYLIKKYDTAVHSIKVSRYNPTTEDTTVTEEDRTLICIKNVVCKYRPHLHLGDYWLDINVVESVPNYQFYYITQSLTGEYIVMPATHPHFSGGKPCLGNFQGDLATAFSDNNFIQFLSIYKAYLQAYNGRSTYVRGSEFKKVAFKYQLHSMAQIQDIFSEHGEVDVMQVGTDPTRWNWPKQVVPVGDMIVEGQFRRSIFEWFREVKYPFLRYASHYNFTQHNWDEHAHDYNKILGYVYLAQKIGELELSQAFEFVRIFLVSLNLQYHGDLDEEKQVALRKLANDCYSINDRGRFTINSRYTVSLDGQNREEMTTLNKELSIYRQEDRTEAHFIKELKWGGDKLSNFMILLRKKAPDKAAGSVYLYKLNNDVDLDAYQKQYNRVKKFAYGLALTQLEKDKRRFISELNRPEVANIIPDDGQGTLFSENL